MRRNFAMRRKSVGRILDLGHGLQTAMYIATRRNTILTDLPKSKEMGSLETWYCPSQNDLLNPLCYFKPGILSLGPYDHSDYVTYDVTFTRAIEEDL